MSEPPNELLDRITSAEGIRRIPYLDTAGVLTLGIGHRLSEPISIRACDMILTDDLFEAQKQLLTALTWVTKLDPVRYWSLTELTFNLGIRGLMEFEHMLGSLERGLYVNAAEALLQSKWATEVGASRSERISLQLRDGKWH